MFTNLTTSSMLAVLALLTVGCAHSDGRSTGPDAFDRATGDIEASVMETPENIQKSADDIGDGVSATPERVVETGDETVGVVESVTD